MKVLPASNILAPRADLLGWPKTFSRVRFLTTTTEKSFNINMGQACLTLALYTEPHQLAAGSNVGTAELTYTIA